MITKDIPVRVRYKETDSMGVVHHSNYVVYYEQARTEFLRDFGTTYRAMEEAGIMMPVVEVAMQFFAPALYDDLLTIRIRLSELPKVRITFEHEVFNEAGTLLNTGRVVLAFMRRETRRPCRAPQWFVDLLGPCFEKETL